MQNLGMLDFEMRETGGGAFLGEAPDAHDPIGLENFNAGTEMGVASREKRCRVALRQFIGSEIAGALLHEDQGAVIKNEMFFEKRLSGAEPIGE